MTPTRYPASQNSGGHAGDCGCHGPADACTLECLEHPKFFCGQLLTDQDLTSLVQWVQNKSRLLRYRHGWGVVCGLDVRCQPHYHDQVLVTGGYAVDCCGNDVIVCEAAPFSLAGVCRNEKDPCAELRKKGPAAEEGRPEVLVPGFDTGKVPLAEIRIIDLYLHYREQLADAQTALGRSVCKQVSECEYSRVREGFELTWKHVVSETRSAGAPAEDGAKQQEQCAEVVRRFREFSGGRITDSARTREWLCGWIEKHPIKHLCFVADWICHPDTDLSKEVNVVQALSWLVLDCRGDLSLCDSSPCESDAGVPLARIWLRCEVVKGRPQVQVQLVDAYPPFRRVLALDSRSVSPARLFWLRPEDARAELARAGVLRVDEKPYQAPAKLADLEKSLAAGLPAALADVRTLFIWDGGRLGQRVVDVGA
jgi:hypothetical protein